MLPEKKKNCISLVTSYINKVDITSYILKNYFSLDGKHANLTQNDVQRRNRIAKLLSDWGLIAVIAPESIIDIAPLNQIKVLSYKDKSDWILETKYNIGKKGKDQESE